MNPHRWFIAQFRQQRAMAIPDEGPFRTQGSKPPKPPAPPFDWMIPLRKFVAWIFFGNNVPSWDLTDLRFGWFLLIGFALVGIIVTTVCVGGDTISTHFSPCIDGKTASGTKASTAPDGTPVQIPTSWCVHYKPGREGETP